MKTLLCASLLLLASGAAGACGVCIEDKIASSYDHAVVTRARAQGQRVAFFAIRSDVPRSERVASEVKKGIARIRGAQPATLRMSLENAAFSFAFDPALFAPDALERELLAQMARSGIAVGLLRTL